MKMWNKTEKYEFMNNLLICQKTYLTINNNAKLTRILYSAVSHSATSDMKVIDQVSPVKEQSRSSRSSNRGDFFDEFDLGNSRGGSSSSNNRFVSHWWYYQELYHFN